MKTIPMMDSYQRKSLSPEALSILVDIAAADSTRPLSDAKVDWNEVLGGILRNGLIGLAYFSLSSTPEISGPPPEFRAEIKKGFLAHSLRMAWINRNIKQVLSFLNESGIDYLVVKGPAIAFGVYPAPQFRVYNDLDLIIRERNWADFSRLMLQHNYTVLAGEAMPPPKVISNEMDHETEYLNPEGNFRVEAHYDDLLRTGLAARNVDGFWERSIHMEMDGISFKTLCLEDHLIYLCAHAHHHNYARINWFCDIALLLRKVSSQIDWRQVIDTVKLEEAQTPVYYGLYFVEQLLGVRAPESFMKAIRPDPFRVWMHDLLMPPKKVLSFEPLPNVIFSFYYYPFYQRLLPDFLVMGRRKDKLRFLLKVLLPPGDWLRYIYKDQKGDWIGQYYLFHWVSIASYFLKDTLSFVTRARWNELGETKSL